MIFSEAWEQLRGVSVSSTELFLNFFDYFLNFFGIFSNYFWNFCDFFRSVGTFTEYFCISHGTFLNFF